MRTLASAPTPTPHSSQAWREPRRRVQCSSHKASMNRLRNGTSFELGNEAA